MELNLSPYRVALCLAYIGAFWLLGGFTSPWADTEYTSAGRSGRAWGACMLMFLGGAASASLIDHFAGVMEPKNLRLVYVVIGVLLMVGSVIWINALRDAVTTG